MVDRRVPGRTATLVTPAEVKAARMKVRLLLERGDEPSAALVAIANARRVSTKERLESQSA